MSAIPTENISYLTGFTVKPAAISQLGTVTFTDGVNAVAPNQIQCEAYGYTYNVVNGTCNIFRYNTNLDIAVANENNRTYGTGNSTETGTNNTLIMGVDNTVRGLSRNNIIIGNENQIANGINNTNVSGTLGEATATNSTVLGGNATDDLLGERQSIRVLFGKQTINNSVLSTNMNNTAGSKFDVPDNTILYFHATCLAVRVGGTNTRGAVGDYYSAIERGVVINKSGTTTIQRERDVIKTSGVVTGWVASAAVTGNQFGVTIRGAIDMTLEWACDVKFTQIKTGVAL